MNCETKLGLPNEHKLFFKELIGICKKYNILPFLEFPCGGRGIVLWKASQEEVNQVAEQDIEKLFVVKVLENDEEPEHFVVHVE